MSKVDVFMLVYRRNIVGFSMDPEPACQHYPDLSLSSEEYESED